VALPDAGANLAGRFTSRSTWALIGALIALVGALRLCLDRFHNGDFYLSLVSGRIVTYAGLGSYFKWRSPETRVVLTGWLEHFTPQELRDNYGVLRNGAPTRCGRPGADRVLQAYPPLQMRSTIPAGDGVHSRIR
jgi:hypothetical protein